MLIWDGPRNGSINGVPLRYVDADYAKARTTLDEIIVLKPKAFFDEYAALYPEPPKTLLEVGVFEGGSALIFAEMWPEVKITGIDSRKRNDDLIQLINRFGLSDRISLHYETSQADLAALNRILDAEMPEMDLIIDDASHLYQLSRKCFEILFPRLKPGGRYIIEDWGWAHWESWAKLAQYTNEPALSNLVWELCMATATSPRIVSQAQLDSRKAVFRKAMTCPKLACPVALEELYTARGQHLQHLL